MKVRTPTSAVSVPLRDVIEEFMRAGTTQPGITERTAKIAERQAYLMAMLLDLLVDREVITLDDLRTVYPFSAIKSLEEIDAEETK